MPDNVQDPLTSLSAALVERTRLARPLVAGIAAPGHQMRSGTLWRKDVVVASEQSFPDAGEAKVTLADGSAFTAHLAGRDPGTNVVAFRLDGTPDTAPTPAEEPHPGALVLAFGAEDGGVAVRRQGFSRGGGGGFGSKRNGRRVGRAGRGDFRHFGLLLIIKTIVRLLVDLIGHLRQKSFVDDKRVTDFFLYKGLDKGISTECGKDRHQATGNGMKPKAHAAWALARTFRTSPDSDRVSK